MEKLPSFPGSKVFTVGKINIAQGDLVEEGQELFQIETKKGNRSIKAKSNGRISQLLVTEGESVTVGQDIYELAASDTQTDSSEILSKKEISTSKEIINKSVNLLIIGGGTGGYVAAIRAAKAGKNVLLVEKNKMGGTCLNVGCIPTKALIASSELYEQAIHSKDFGIMIDGQIKPDMPAIIDRKNQIVEKLTTGVEFLMEKNQIEVIIGQASFINNTSVKIDSEQETIVTFEDCIIATGSVVAIPNIPGIDSKHILTSTEALDNRELPRSMVIVGGGVIGLEFAFLYAQLGVSVTVIEFMDALLANMDAEISKTILDIAREKGIKVYLESKVSAFSEAVDGQVITHFQEKGKEQFAISEKVLVAVGRKPNIEELALEKTDVTLNEKTRGILVDNHMKTVVDHIYAVGDVNNMIQLAHAASKQGMIAVENILGMASEFTITNTPSVVFTSPEIASVGLSEEATKAVGIDYKVGYAHFEANGKSLTLNQTQGFVKIIKDQTDTVIGASVIGPDASTLIATLTTYVTNKMKLDEIEQIIFAHPTTAEVIHEASLDLGLGAFHE
ncbi:Dihydrolipoyl dehydrogenase [Streptococcus parauberis]|uniref:Dihydrolipoyl dehydrogenase n=1 Tax=Streptococcus parauberis KRS-02083 TaxID=1207545 RepID=A0ABP2SZG4_9STRE|nr:dihydrolipoyl dehydrogenase [Streptococcus parauberis]AUT06126.1 Dihydrolipoyl dehydrogenase [Streptococcus parauberis]EMG25866.1 Dihydrolipoamide dehydrogenase [Streptococcus parauberis KRS-02083]UWV09519.1 dihydrolipoyl dehydrogenase [Streptococcus parauberis]WEM64218.1 dihydrolipoyl dehydrogenase [Streptococcus parauberis]WOF46045.1 dihydrolipoyl dehydrogenase [Streptococcus parauberis]